MRVLPLTIAYSASRRGSKLTAPKSRRLTRSSSTPDDEIDELQIELGSLRTTMSAPLSSRYSHESLPPFSLLSLAAGPTETLTGPPVLGKAARILGVELNAGGMPARGARKLQKRRAGPGRLMRFVRPYPNSAFRLCAQ